MKRQMVTSLQTIIDFNAHYFSLKHFQYTELAPKNAEPRFITCILSNEFPDVKIASTGVFLVTRGSCGCEVHFAE